jgi:hypothetical protein
MEVKKKFQNAGIDIADGQQRNNFARVGSPGQMEWNETREARIKSAHEQLAVKFETGLPELWTGQRYKLPHISALNTKTHPDKQPEVGIYSRHRNSLKLNQGGPPE